MRRAARSAPARRLVPAWLGLLLAAYLIGPLAAFAVALVDGSAGAAPGGPSGPGLGAALLVSVLAATVAAAICALLGVPLAYLLARSRSRWLGAVGIAVQLPIALPPLMSGLLLLAVVGPYTPLGRLFGGGLTDSFAGVVLAQLFVAAPFLVIAARSAFGAVDPALEEVAATLGRGPLDRFLRIVVPAASKGIAAGLVLAWLRAFGEFGATVVLAYHPYSLPVYTFVQFGSAGLRATVAPLAVTLATAAGVVLAAAMLFKLPHRRSPQLPTPRRPAGLSAGTAAPMLRFEVTGRAGGFEVAAGSGPARHLAVLGPSGAGKTLLLRLLAGLAPASSGAVRLGADELWTQTLEQRGIGYVPQESALLPGRSVWRQVMLGPDADPAVAAWWLRRLGLEGLADRRPDELSGGQRRRVAIVRSLAQQPRLLLLDEPFTGLDAEVRAGLRRDLRRLQAETPISTVLVTHDPDDAAVLSDHVLVMDAGRILAAGAFGDLRRAPAGPTAARLLGLPNVFPGDIAGGDELCCGSTTVPAETRELGVGRPVTWHVPPSAVRVGQGGLTARVVDVADWGDSGRLWLQIGPGVEIEAVSAVGPWPSVGSLTTVGWDPRTVQVWPEAARTAEPAVAG